MSSETRTVLIQLIGFRDEDLMRRLTESLIKTMGVFNLKFESCSEYFPLRTMHFNSGRGQFNASEILASLSEYLESTPFFRVLGVIDKDIYVEGLNFVFGLAQKPPYMSVVLKRAALISTARLSGDLDGRSVPGSLFRLRVLKEAMHELGHTFSLGHCENNCVMRFSNMLVETDLKPAFFCESCFNRCLEFFSSM